MTLPAWWPSKRPYIIADCMTVMKSMPDKCVDMTFTSPPFKDEDVMGDYWTKYDKWFREMQRITSKTLIIIHSSTKINELIIKYPPKRLLIWYKGQSKYAYRFNPILVYQMTDDYKVNKFIYSDVFKRQSICGVGKTHPYEDPVSLYTALIKMFKGCEIVFDPFLGSGTTLDASGRCNKLGMGCEINPDYEPIIRKRSMQDITRLDYFGGLE